MAKSYLRLIVAPILFTSFLVGTEAAVFGDGADLLRLEQALADLTFVPFHWRVEEGGWEAAKYVAGVLAHLGYEVKLGRTDTRWVVLVHLTEERDILVLPGPIKQGRWLRLGYIDPSEPAPIHEVQELPLNSPPVAKSMFSVVTAEANRPFVLNAMPSYDPDGAIVLVRWAFPDGTFAEGFVVTEIFADPGIYQVRLIVVDDAGAWASQEVTVIIGSTNVPPPGGCAACGKK